jgi:opacity protein-like surface antigen
MGQGASAISSAVSTVETAFLAQQGSAFVSAPPDPAPNQPGGGVWARAVGGEVNTKTVSNTSINTTFALGGASLNATNTTCSNAMRLDFAGAQVGTDIARLNWNGWNIHLGATAGFIGANTNDTNQQFPFSNTFQVPFLGTYLVATKGRFFADLMVREEVFNINLNNQGFAFNNQPLGAHGFSISTSAGYNFDAGHNWFVEPSAGFIYSRTAVDPFTVAGSLQTNGIPATVSINDIESELGRLSLRAGRTIETSNAVWQPFASVSVFHEFAGNTTSTATGGSFLGAPIPVIPVNVTGQNSTSRVGTYEQYSIGLAAQLINTGVLGYVRADYKDGDNINGWGFSTGIRYQFTPEMIASVMPVKVKAPPHAYIAPTNWTGFYVGGVAGADSGRTDVTVLTTPAQSERPWVAGGLAGIEAGYNQQYPNNWVLGVEGDIAATNTHGARNLPPQGSPGLGFPTLPLPNTVEVSDRTNWIATITGKLGYAYERTLLYVKAGAAFEDSKVSGTCNDPQLASVSVFFVPCSPTALALTPFAHQFVPGLAADGASTSTTRTRLGWTAGFGTEFDLGKGWSAKSEVDFLDFGRHTALSSNGLVSLSDWNHLWQGKIGVNYHFNSGPVFGTAMAADLPVKAAPAPAPVMTWSAFYAGLNAGGIWSNNDPASHTAVAGPCDPIFAGCSFVPNGPNYSSTLATGSNFNTGFGNRAGFTGGGQFGYNWQFNSRGVAGLEADMNWTAQNKSVTFTSLTPNANFPAFPEPYTAAVSRKLDYLATVRGRLGFLATPSVLLYGTGGLAFGEASSLTQESTTLQNCDGAGGLCSGFGGGSYLHTRIGWTAGAGGEWMFAPNWSAKAEYLYYDLGTANYATVLSQSCLNGFFCAATGTTAALASTTGTTSVRFNGSIARFGINYHFAPGLVVAKD